MGNTPTTGTGPSAEVIPFFEGCIDNTYYSDDRAAGLALPLSLEWIPEPDALNLYREWVAARRNYELAVGIAFALEERYVDSFCRGDPDAPRLKAKQKNADVRLHRMTNLEQDALYALMAYQPAGLYAIALKLLATDAFIDDRDEDHIGDPERLAARVVSDLRRLIKTGNSHE